MDLRRYQKRIKDIKKYATKNDISEEQVNKIFTECFQSLESKTQTKISLALKLFKNLCIICLIVIISIIVLYNHPKTHNILLRNLQNFIYPGLRIFRKIAVPVITLYPSLTKWYDEWCLVENPYFQVNGMECWPCNSVHSIQDFTGFNITSAFNTAIPFVRTEKVENVNMNKLYHTYKKSENIFNTNSESVVSNKAFYRTIHDVMHRRPDMYPFSNKDTHIKWRINRMEPGRKLRKLFPKLPGVPEWWSPSTEKYIFIDEPKSIGYKLPNPECANIIIQCTNGERLIQLNPSPECFQNCQTLRVLLKAKQSLWYNWWYWRPVSLPSDNVTSITIMYLTSFC